MRYETIWRNKFLSITATSFDEMIQMLDDAVETLKEMRKDGIKLDPDGGTCDDYALLYTEDKAIADKYGLEEEYFEDEDINEEYDEEEEEDII